MYQALVRIKNDDMTATTPAATPSEASRLDWAAVLDDLLRRMREAARAGTASPRR